MAKKSNEDPLQKELTALRVKSVTEKTTIYNDRIKALQDRIDKFNGRKS